MIMLACLLLLPCLINFPLQGMQKPIPDAASAVHNTQLEDLKLKLETKVLACLLFIKIIKEFKQLDENIPVRGLENSIIDLLKDLSDSEFGIIEQMVEQQDIQLFADRQIRSEFKRYVTNISKKKVIS